jgi:K(+)-stimulated pyrophosphate-energized sodium pump
MVFPLLVAAIGVIASVVGVLATRPSKSDASGMVPINRGFFASAAVSLVLVAAASFTYLPSIADVADLSVSPQVVGFVSVLIGVVLAATIQQLTGYFTETSRKPVKDIGRSSLTGPATVILSGISLGLESAVYAALLIGGAVYGAFLIGGGSTVVALFAVALPAPACSPPSASSSRWTTFGPISDNAQGIAEMSGEVTEEGALVLTSLDAVGNTTKAITRASRSPRGARRDALFGSFRTEVGAGLGRGGRSPRRLQPVDRAAEPAVRPHHRRARVFLFSAWPIQRCPAPPAAWCLRGARAVPHQAGIMTTPEKPDYARVVDICTKDSLRELATPGCWPCWPRSPWASVLGIGPLAAYLVGAIAAGTLMAVFLANSGGAWDNAKKMVEDGAYGGKGSEAHAATVIGDTVGDPFKDTAGPAINPLIKVMNLVALIIAPAVVTMSVGEDASTGLRVAIALGAVLVIVVAVVVSKRRSVVVGDSSSDTSTSLTTSVP